MQNPFELFESWFREANKTAMVEPNSMVLSTVDSQGYPSSRVVLLKVLRDETFYFFTNYESKKSQDLLARPFASLNFHWRLPEHRQVRIVGSVSKAAKEISDEYFNSRPRGSQIGAWASPQSQPIASRAQLAEKVSSYEKAFENKPVPRPEYWGGFAIVPEQYEFWQEGENRLHTRRRFTRTNEKTWTESLLAP